MCLSATGANNTSNVTQILPGLWDNQLAFTASSKYQPYWSKAFSTPNVSTWIQVDLGEAVQPISRVELHPFLQPHSPSYYKFLSYGFPVRYKSKLTMQPISRSQPCSSTVLKRISRTPTTPWWF